MGISTGRGSHTGQRVESPLPRTRAARLPLRAAERQPEFMSRQTPESLYELAFRESDGIEVALLWDGVEDRVLLSVRDRRTGVRFVCGVDHAAALDAYRHPFAYVARRHPDAGAISAAA